MSDSYIPTKPKRRFDFAQKSRTGTWAENLIETAINSTKHLFAKSYGPSGPGPEDEYNEYWFQLDSVGNGSCKRPDQLVFHKKDEAKVNKIIESLGGVKNLPFLYEKDMRPLLALAIGAIECEASRHETKNKRGFLNPSRAKYLELLRPNIIVKEEDRDRLRLWNSTHNIPIFVAHCFFDNAWIVHLEKVEMLINLGMVTAHQGGNFPKESYLIPFQDCVHLGEVSGAGKEMCLTTSKNGRDGAEVFYIGGQIDITSKSVDYMLHFGKKLAD